MDGLTLRTPRLTLRPPRPSDVEAISALSSAWEVARMTTRIPHPNPPQSVRAFFASLGEARELALVIDDGRPAGFVGYGKELGYWIGTPFWGRGYAKEAAEAMLTHLSPIHISEPTRPQRSSDEVIWLKQNQHQHTCSSACTIKQHRTK